MDCEEEKSLSDFYGYSARDSKRPYCKSCTKKRAAGWRKENPKAVFRWKLKRSYGITPERLEQMQTEQEGLCKICKQKCKVKRRLSIDHDHTTKKVRGLLCGNCNHGLGHFRDSPDLLRAAAEYIENSRK